MTPPPRYGYGKQQQQGYNVYDQNQPRFSAPGQFFIKALGVTPPQLYQMPTVQDQLPPGYQFQQ